ncbi:DsbA family protein (plasmid) [Cereibacter azotoformans]|uniref:DsbA family protein n=1 Tax=Cereibacter azotoformans TaxID=43057 RepID=UPI003B20C05E
MSYDKKVQRRGVLTRASVAGALAGALVMAAGQGVVMPLLDAAGQGGAQSEPGPEFADQVRSVLLSNPEVVLEVFAVLERQEKDKQAAGARAAVEAEAAALFQGADARKGNASAPVVAVEFFDYQCGYCKSALPELAAALSGRNDVAVVMKEFPILGSTSEAAARLALAVRAEHGDEAYLGFHNALLSHKGGLNEAALSILAGAAGYDYPALVARGRQDDITSTLQGNRRLAQALAISGTPAFVFRDGEVVPGMMAADRLTAAFDRLSASVAAAR